MIFIICFISDCSLISSKLYLVVRILLFQNNMSVVAPMHSTSYEVSNPSPPLSDFNSGSSDEYHEKFDNLKVLVRELQKQLKSQRVQGDALHTLNTCLDEERRENTDLREQIKNLEHVVTVLRERLLANKLSAQTEFEASDPLIITPSKQLLDNLVEENIKLQEKLKYLQVDPVKLEQLYKVGFFSSCIIMRLAVFHLN